MRGIDDTDLYRIFLYLTGILVGFSLGFPVFPEWMVAGIVLVTALALLFVQPPEEKARVAETSDEDPRDG